MDPTERWANGLELLLRLSLELHAQRDLRSLLERIWADLTRVMVAERSSLFLVDNEGGELYSVIAQQEGEIRVPLGEGIAGAVADSGQSLLIADAQSDPRFNPEIDRRTGFTTQSLLTVPLKSPRGEVLGVAQVLNRQDGRPFDDTDLMLLQALAATAAVAIETLQLIEAQQQATEAVISGLVIALDMREPRGAHHAQEVRVCSGALARALGFDREAVRRIEWAAALHDLGKLAVPDGILHKESPLVREERTRYEAHAECTRDFLRSMAFSGELAGLEEIAPYHHKRFEGGGFPAGPPEGTDVPVEARIIGVADAMSVQMSHRWGRPPRTWQEALAWVEERSGRDFDPDVVDALRTLTPQLPSGAPGGDPGA